MEDSFAHFPDIAVFFIHWLLGYDRLLKVSRGEYRIHEFSVIGCFP